MSANEPLVRTSPPSEPKNTTFGLLGKTAIACESGCIPFGVVSEVASRVRSLKLAPPSFETM